MTPATRIMALAAALPLSLLAADRPNVVLIISDDQAWTDYGFMDHPVIQTPHLDRLARESVCYPKGYVPDSLCRPSLVTIVTGLYPHQHGVVGNDPPPPAGVDATNKRKLFGDPRYLAIRNQYLTHIDKHDTLADILGEVGYASHQSGKWWEGHYSRGGFTQGMTHGDRTRGGRHGDEGLKIGRNGMEPVFGFIDEQVAADKPFFVYYAPFLPHTPHNPPKRLLDKYTAEGRPVSIAKYYAMCDWFDETCGQLIDKVEDVGETDNTVFLYVCDNGWITREDASRYAPRSKRSQYEGGTRTPIMVKAPGVKPRMVDIPVSSIDLVPTTLAACGLDVPSDLPGVNLLDESAVQARDAVFGEIFEHDIRHMTDPVPSLRFRWVIADGWKLIVPYAPNEADAEIELFHVAEDPHEKVNLASKKADLVEKLRTMLDNWWTPVPAAVAKAG